MGNLIIKKVKYSGDKYSFESPELKKGINIIVGDNGSGKSTFSYLIEYGLGGTVKPFIKNDNSKKNKDDENTIITDDSNNYVILEILINGNEYILKRFIGFNDMLIKEKGKFIKLPINRSVDSPRIFSDWILEKLNITVCEINSGSSHWLLGFKDLFRLLNVDQDSDPKKIFKNPSSENFITESSAIRKSIFETLVGISSEKYYNAFSDFKNAERKRSDAKSILDNFNNLHSVNIGELSVQNEKLNELSRQLDKLIDSRDTYQKDNVSSEHKITELAEIQGQLISLNIKISEESSLKHKNEIERDKIEGLLNELHDEISQIEKIIFTNKQLDLFSLKYCPFCMSNVNLEEGYCICGSKINDEDYNKFVYNSIEYKQILDHKKKSIKAINTAFDSYSEEILNLEKSILKDSEDSEKLKKRLESIISKIAFSGNSQLVDGFNDKINSVKEEIFEKEKEIEVLTDKKKLEDSLKNCDNTYRKKKKEFDDQLKIFNKNNAETIEAFNEIYSNLLAKSSCSSNYAEINDVYMPYIDGGTYKERSTVVPIRLMYYFTLLSLGMKRDSVKHPRFLLIDTPEDAGIDPSNLKLNIKLLDNALELSKNSEEDEIKEYQVILTTGFDKYPAEYNKFVKLKFNKEEGKYIFSKKEF